MGRLTKKAPNGDWTLLGMDWAELGDLRPKVYGALCKLLTLEDMIDELNRDRNKTGAYDLTMLSALLSMSGPLGVVTDGEVVHCKDCTHLTFSDCYGECGIQLRIVNPKDTCQFSKRRGGDHHA